MNRKIYLAVVVALSSQVHAQDTVLPTVDVKADTITDASSSSLSIENSVKSTPADGGEWLLQVPGVSGVKMGGHGIDPVIRGQKHNQLNILLDGAYVHGACPNRMDPPTSYASGEIYDDVTVLKGVQTLIYGAGGSGGTVLFDRKAPSFAEGETVKGKYGAGYRSNGEAWDAFADIAAGSNGQYIRATIDAKEANEYEDGDGNEVHSGYQERSGNITVGATTEAGTHLNLDVKAVRGEDILYAGARMDSPKANEDSAKLKVETGKVGNFEQLRFEAYKSDVFHIMDNYTYRDNTGGWMRVPSESNTTGGRVMADIPLSNGTLTVGIDMQNNERDAIRYMSMMPAYPTMIQSYLWPGVEIEQSGLIAEYTGQTSSGNRYTAGLRYDMVDASASKADLDPMGAAVSADSLYSTYYGTTAEDKDENNVSALYRMEHDLSATKTVFWGISHTVRTADATERYMAANAMMMNPITIWVGNPDINPEKHNQLDVGVSTKGKNSSYSVSAYIDKVSDYILRDTARGQEGILLSNGATIYRNVDAELMGMDLEANYKWTRQWQSRFTVAYVRAENDSDGKPIAQIPPLEATASLEYQGAGWMLGGELRAVARQTRVDDDPSEGSGLDFGETDGFNIVNLYGSYRISKQGELKFGIDNVFDKLYAEHLNKPNAFDPQQIQVNEPGRSVWARVNMNF